MIVTLENFIVSYDTIIDYDTKELHDRWFFFLLCLFWVVIHVIIFVGAHRFWFVRSWEKTEEEDNEIIILRSQANYSTLVRIKMTRVLMMKVGRTIKSRSDMYVIRDIPITYVFMYL